MPSPIRTRILIVDDDEGMIDSLVVALEDEFDVVTAVNGAEGLAVMAARPIDVVILDLMMPVLDGEGFMRAHAVRHPAVPVLLLSADLDLRQRASALGVDDHLHKPFSLATLESKLRRLAAGGGSSGATSSDPAAGRIPGDGGGGSTLASWRAAHGTMMSSI